ncbi:ANTAR domain-containing protein [Streptomyces sp. NPDC057302]|uniref:ANTAR domain-containing protein n=1 Tax=Streptomyces sp. NPDC057302 TaxID=3346094 RepID=UPI003636BE8B
MWEPSVVAQRGEGSLLHVDTLVLGRYPLVCSITTLQFHGEHTEALEELQLVQGQGPSLDTAQYGIMVLAPDLAQLSPSRWPGLPTAINNLGVHAVFAFPLRIGIIALGVLTGHRTTPGPMTREQLTDALGLADALAQLLIGLTARPGAPAALLLDDPGLRFSEVHQATGMLSAQLGITCAQVLLRLRGYAFGHDRPLLETARAILARQLRLDDPDGGSRRP